MPATLVAAAAVEVAIDWATSPVSPGLPTRTEMATLHDVQTVIPSISSGGGASAHAQCQFRTIVVAPAGGAGTAGSPASAAQFQNQFQIKTCGAIGEVDDDVSTVIPLAGIPVVLPVSPSVGSGARTDTGGGPGVTVASGRTGAGDGESGAGAASGEGVDRGVTSTEAGGITGGIVDEIVGITGMPGKTGITGITGISGTCGSAAEAADESAAATIAAGSTAAAVPSSARVGLAASAATAPHTERARTNDGLLDMMQEDMYPSARPLIRKISSNIVALFERPA